MIVTKGISSIIIITYYTIFFSFRFFFSCRRCCTRVCYFSFVHFTLLFFFLLKLSTIQQHAQSYVFSFSFIHTLAHTHTLYDFLVSTFVLAELLFFCNVSIQVLSEKDPYIYTHDSVFVYFWVHTLPKKKQQQYI